MLGIYRLPGKHTVNQFLNEFLDFLEAVRAEMINLIIMGDFNISVNLHELKCEVEDFVSSMNALGFEQHSTFYTHCKGTILDLVFTECITSVSVMKCYPGPFLSGHR